MSSSKMSDKTQKRHIILGCTGSVATIKIPSLAKKLMENGFLITTVPTQHALYFLKTQGFQEGRELKDSSSEENFLCKCKSMILEKEVKELYPELNIVTDADEWSNWRKRGDPIEHIELREFADLILIAPLDANTLAKLANGLCDNFLTCILRAWNMKKPVIFCPAMNTKMYSHPFTKKHIISIKELGYIEIPAISKTLMCGETGDGAMAEVDDIVAKVVEIAKNLA